MQTATPRAQLHLLRLLEKSGEQPPTNTYGAVSISLDYGIAGRTSANLYPSPNQRGSDGEVHRSSSGGATTPLSRRRRSILSITRDVRSASSPRIGRATEEVGSTNHRASPGGGACAAPYVRDPHEAGPHAHATDDADLGDDGILTQESRSQNRSDLVNDTAVDALASVESSSAAAAAAAADRESDSAGGAETGLTGPPPRDAMSEPYQGYDDSLDERAPSAEDAEGADPAADDEGAHRAPAHEAIYRPGSSPAAGQRLDAQGWRSASRGHGRAGTPLTVYDAEGHPICDVGFDEDGNPATITYDEDGSPVYGDPGNSTLPGSIVVELLNQREEARRLAEERDEMRARLEELERSHGTISPGGGANTPVTLGNTHVGVAGYPATGYETPERGTGGGISQPHLLFSLPEESPSDYGTRADTGNGAMAERSDSPDDVERAEERGRHRLLAVHDDSFLTLLEEADAALKRIESEKRVSLVSLVRSGSTAPEAKGATPNSRALVPADEMIAALHQEKEISELRDGLTEAEEKIAKLEETNTALRLQLVLEKARRTH